MIETEIDSIGVIEHEVSLLIRLAESARKTSETLDRSAYLLLGELEARGPLGIAALAQIFQVDVSTASRQTAALEAKGLVRRLPDPSDGRVSLLQITPPGRMQYEATRVARHALFGDILAGWPEEDCRQFASYLTRLNRSIVTRRQRLQSVVSRVQE